MQELKTKAFRTAYFTLMTAGLPTLFLTVLCGSSKLALFCYIGEIPIAFLLSLLPGHAGKHRLPFRVMITAAAAAALTIGCTQYALSSEVFFARGTAFGLILSAFLFLSVREACQPRPEWTGQHCAAIGTVLYVIPSVSFFFSSTEDMFLQNATWILTIVFLLVTAFYLNLQNTRTGLATRANARPPRSVIRGNRILTLIFAALSAIVVFWGQLREGAVRAAKWLLIQTMRFVNWLMNLLGGEKGTPGGEEQMNPAEIFPNLGADEPNAFWLFMEKATVVLAILIGAILLFLAIRVLVRLLVRVIRRLQAYFRHFAQTSSEDYVDEQVDLFDLDDIADRTRRSIQKAVSRLTHRAPKWDTMTTQEKVRYCIRVLYMRAGYTKGELRPLTIREAARKLPTIGLSEETLTTLYEQARYSTEVPEASEAEKLRKAVKP